MIDEKDEQIRLLTERLYYACLVGVTSADQHYAARVSLAALHQRDSNRADRRLAQAYRAMLDHKADTAEYNRTKEVADNKRAALRQAEMNVLHAKNAKEGADRALSEAVHDYNALLRQQSGTEASS